MRSGTRRAHAVFVKAGHDAGASTPDFTELLASEEVGDEDDLRTGVAIRLDSLWDFGRRIAALCERPVASGS
jgi:hypothetical protein